MFALHRITLQWIAKFKLQLLKLSYLTEEDIRDIWIRQGEDMTVDLSTIIYNYDIPLYQKMIFRFRNCNNSAVRFFHQIDPCNQGIVLRRFGLIFNNMTEVSELCNTKNPIELLLRGTGELVEFFSWIANGLGSYNITMLEFNDFNEELCQKSSFVKSWSKNQVEFFFGLSEQKQQELIDQYNKECVDSYNELINNK